MPDNPGEGYEAGLNPRSLSITYKKYSGVIPNELVVLLWRYSVKENVEIIDAPNWLYVILEKTWLTENEFIGRSDYKIAINEGIANNLAPGNYSAEIKLRGTIGYGFYAGSRLTYTLKVSLTVLEGNLLNLTKKAFSFNYTRGNNLPPGQFLTIKTDNNWSISSDQPWLGFSKINGQGDTTISLSVDPAGINTTTSKANFIVDDGFRQIKGVVYLYIYGSTEDTEDYLHISKKLIQFSESYLEPSSRQTTFQIDSTIPSSISSNVNWLEITPSNAQNGLQNITVKTINTELLEIGTYPAKIEIEGYYNYGSVFIDVVLQIVEETTEGIENGKLYFAEDRNYLDLTNAQANAEAILEFTTNGTLQSLSYQRKAPFLLNDCKILIGQETDILLEPQLLPQLATQTFEPVKPIRYNFEVYDKQMGNPVRQLRKAYSNIFFLNGTTPEGKKMTYLPEVVTVPSNAVICFSFLSEEPADIIEITGDYNTTLPVSATGKVTAIMINIKEFELSPKDQITISCGPIKVKAVIKPTQLPTSQLIWLNEWDCPEIFNCDGILTITDDEESTISTRSREGKEYSKVINIEEPQSFSLTTGNIYSEAEVAHLAKIIRSKKIWLQHGETRWEVIRDFRKFDTSETRRTNRNFKLDFNLATQ